ncbi:protein GET1 isoform X1 [Typha latifolia]|uniref:protein GET1 isoform X1 n=1 Tax=Typha latifolia TaxID=4733 RepID=UPI003C2DD587
MGGGFLSPLSIFLLVAALHLLDRLLEFVKKRGSRSGEQRRLREEINKLLKEASSLSTPSTFAQAAKLRRLAAAKEKELVRNQEENNKEKSYDSYARVLMISKVLIYAGLIWLFWSIPVAAVPQHLLQPFGKIFSWRAGDATSGQVMVGIIPWLVLTSRTSKFLCEKLSKSFFHV